MVCKLATMGQEEKHLLTICFFVYLNGLSPGLSRSTFKVVECQQTSLYVHTMATIAGVLIFWLTNLFTITSPKWTIPCSFQDGVRSTGKGATGGGTDAQ